MAQMNIAPPGDSQGVSVGLLLSVIVAIGVVAFLVWAVALDGVGPSSPRYPTVAPTAVVRPVGARR